MKKYLFVFVLAVALLMSTSVVFAAKGGVPGKPVPPDDGDGTSLPTAQPYR